MRYIKKVISKNRIWVIVYIAFGVVNAFLANYQADYFQRVVDGLADGTLLFGSLMFYGAILAVNYCMNYLDVYPDEKLKHGIYMDFKLLALQKISRIDYQEYQAMGTGRLTQRIENGAEAGRNMIFDFWLCLVRQLLPTVGFCIFFIWRISRPITWAILCGYAAVFIITNLLLKALYQIKEKILSNEEKLNHYLVRGFMELTVFRMERRFPAEIKKAGAAAREIVDGKAKMKMIHEAFFTIFALIVAVLETGILIYAWKSGEITVGAAVALITLINNAYTPIAIFNVLFVEYKLDREGFKRFEEFLDSKEDERLEKGAVVDVLEGGIEVDSLAFRYGERKVLDNVSLTVKPGEKVAFVGESGSGKSTLVKLIAGLLKYGQGSIKLDGKEVKDLCLNSLYGRMSYISQDAPVFDGTVRENLVFEREIEDGRLLDALMRVQLSDVIKNSGDGLDTMVGERGMLLSGGEKQRLALARLWFEENQITLLDEATSAMDNLTEEAVMEELVRLLAHRTLIAVAHRLSSVRNFDRIIVFKQGRIVGQGKFDELLESNAYFRELYHAALKSRQ